MLWNTFIANFVLGAAGTQLNSALTQIVGVVKLIGGTAFSLAVMIIGLVIIFGSVSAAKMRGLWVALISCIAGAFIFFSADFIVKAIQEISK